MAATTPYEVTVPAPHTASFTDGEMALAVASPTGSAAARTGFYLSRWINLPAGVFTLKCVAENAATWWIGEDESNIALIGSTTFAQGVVNLTFMVQRPGRMRLDVVLQNLSTSAGQCYTAFSISRAGSLVYASRNTGWLFDTVRLADGALVAAGDARLSLPVFSVLPNWAEGILERLEYKTEVLSSETDAEQRRMLRMHPRRSIEASFMRGGAHRARLDVFTTGHGNREFMCPLWHEQYRPTGGLAVGQTLVTFPADSLVNREFNVGNLVFVNNGDPDTFEVLTISGVDLEADTITFSAGPVATWPEGTRIIPLRRCEFEALPQLQNRTASVGTVTLRVHMLDHSEYEPEEAWGYCAPLFRFKPDMSEAIDLNYSRKTFGLDNDTGVSYSVDPGERTRTVTKMSVMLVGRHDVWRLRKFIAAARGKAVRFWAPTNTYDIVPTGNLGGAYIEAKPTGFWESMQKPQDARIVIGVYFADGRPTMYRQVSYIEPVALVGPPWRMSAERFHLDVPLPAIDAASVSRVGFVVPSRFDQDSFELRHFVDDSKVVRTALVTRSAEIEGMPPIDCWETSWTYPLALVEAIDTAPSITGATLRELLIDPGPEAVDAAPTVVSATLVMSLVTYDAGAEAVDAAPTVVSATLEEVLIVYDAGAEAVDAVPSITGGTLV